MDVLEHPAMTERAAKRTAPLSRTDISFAARLDGDDAGIEPGDAIGENLAALFEGRESAVVELPAGRYPVEAPIVLEDATSAGLVGKPGADVVLDVPSGYERALLAIRDVDHALVAGIDVDQRAPSAHPKLGVSANQSFLIEDLTIGGIGDSTDSGSRMPLRIGREDGIGVLRRVRAVDGSAVPEDPTTHESGETTRPATWIGPKSRGEMWFEDCRFEEHNSHAIYAAATPGPLKVLRGVYRNNDNSQIRFCGPGCEVDGALIELDTRTCKHTAHDAYRRTRGLFNEQKKHPRTGGLVRDTTIRVGTHPNPVGGYVAHGSGGGMRIEGCEFEIDAEECPAIRADAPGGFWGHPPAPEPRAIEVVESRVHGSAKTGTAIRIAGRPASRVERCCVAGRSERRGVAIDAGTVRETTFDIEDEAVVSAGTVAGIREGSCADFFDGDTDSPASESERGGRPRRKGNRAEKRGRRRGPERKRSGGVLTWLLKRFDLD